MAENESFFWGIIRNLQERRNRKKLLRNVSIQNEKIKLLIQEVSILKERIDKNGKEN